jgi:hypothetical protein
MTLISTDLGDLLPAAAPVLVDEPKTYQVLADPDACQLLEICLGTLSPSGWAARSMLARAVWRVISRLDVSERLGWTDHYVGTATTGADPSTPRENRAG